MFKSMNHSIADLFQGKPLTTSAQQTSNAGAPQASAMSQTDNALAPQAQKIRFSFLFFSDVRKDISNRQKYQFTRQMVEYADQSQFEAVYFPERHFYEFGSIFANNAIMAAYFAPLTKNVRLRTAAVSATLHHPAAIVENWAMVDILSEGRVDLGLGNGWSKSDFILSPDTWHDRVQLRNERIEIIRKLWRGESVAFAGPDGEMFDTVVHPRPLQKELNVWYVTNTDHGFEYAGRMGYNVFTMLYAIDLDQMAHKIAIYRQARCAAGLAPEAGQVSLMMHTFTHPDLDWVHKVVASPFKDYIRSSISPHMKFAQQEVSEADVNKMVDYSYARYFSGAGIFGTFADCQRQIDKCIRIGVDEIAFLQDFGMDYSAVTGAFEHLDALVQHYRAR